MMDDFELEEEEAVDISVCEDSFFDMYDVDRNGHLCSFLRVHEFSDRRAVIYRLSRSAINNQWTKEEPFSINHNMGISPDVVFLVPAANRDHFFMVLHAADNSLIVLSDREGCILGSCEIIGTEGWCDCCFDHHEQQLLVPAPGRSLVSVITYPQCELLDPALSLSGVRRPFRVASNISRLAVQDSSTIAITVFHKKKLEPIYVIEKVGWWWGSFCLDHFGHLMVQTWDLYLSMYDDDGRTLISNNDSATIMSSSGDKLGLSCDRHGVMLIGEWNEGHWIIYRGEVCTKDNRSRFGMQIRQLLQNVIEHGGALSLDLAAQPAPSSAKSNRSSERTTTAERGSARTLSSSSSRRRQSAAGRKSRTSSLSTSVTNVTSITN